MKTEQCLIISGAQVVLQGQLGSIAQALPDSGHMWAASGRRHHSLPDVDSGERTA